jgi:cell division protein FtsQ
VVEVLNGLRGESLIWTDLGAWRKRLMASPWVRDAALRRSLPSTIDVVISERAPVGIGRIHGEMYLVDDRGSIIDQYGPRYSNLDLPIIDGLAIRSNDAGLMTDEARAELAARVIQAIAAKPDVARKVSQIDVTDLHNATVILNDDGALIQLGEDQFLQRIESYLDLAATLRERVADIDYVDLRFGEHVYVRPRAGSGRNALAQAGPAPRRSKPAGE